MGENKLKTAWTVTGLILIIAVAALLIGRQVARPRETVNDFSKIRPKGAGRFDRN
jgi:hypothetical protein